MIILVATNNPAKVARVRQLLAGRDVVMITPAEAGIPITEVEEGSDIAENAERKARVYFGKINLPILGMDSAFVIPGEDIDPAKVRRNALAGRDEADLSAKEVAEFMIAFYREIVKRRGGPVPAYWEDALALVGSDGTVRYGRSRRPVTLTDAVRGQINPHLPLRSLYIVEATGKYVADQTSEDESKEMRPYQEALERVLGLKK